MPVFDAPILEPPVDPDNELLSRTWAQWAIEVSRALKGAWGSPTFSAGAFTATGGGTWTVAAGDVTTFSYRIVGKSMLVSFVLVTTDVAGGPATLQMAIPAGAVAAAAVSAGVGYASDAGTVVAARCGVVADATVISVNKNNAAAWTNGAGTALSGQLEFPIR